MIFRTFLAAFLIFQGLSAAAQTGILKGRITGTGGKALQYASVSIPDLKLGMSSDREGKYLLQNIPYGTWGVRVSRAGFTVLEDSVSIDSAVSSRDFALEEKSGELSEVVISGTLKEVSRLESPIPVEVYTAKFFKANPTPSLFDALQNINGVRPQLNCNVCNTGDIHINGLEGPYTMILIDGMPIVSGLSSVYGLSGIPQALIDRVEIVKGPASSLYGSEALGGLINIITKKPGKAPAFSADVFGTSWAELNADVAGRFRAGRKAQSLLGINYFNSRNIVDKNHDNFTDVTLQHRVSVFNKWSFDRKENRVLTLAGRYVYEDRWGGDTRWNKSYRGGDEIYGESIYTSRWELLGNYQLPLREKIFFQFSANAHNQNSAYGNTPYLADQRIAFGQFTWFKTLGRHDLLAGLAYRHTYYDDNTPATADGADLSKNKPGNTSLPGLFVQDEISLNENNKLLLGMRYDYNSLHGSILTPRVNYKWSSADKNNVLRLSVGNGYRVANVFTEDHAALTGAREVEFITDLKPETSWNGNLNFVKKIQAGSTLIGLDASAFYTYFTNKIIANYDIDPNKIIYNNLDGYAVSQGISLNVDLAFNNGLKIMAGATAMDVYSREGGERVRQMFAERFTGTWTASYTLRPLGLTVDYTGNLYGPMRLPLLSATDPRREFSPWWSIQNVQLSRKVGKRIEIYGGVKNLLNWTPNKGNPFIIARTNDPFDKNVQFDANGQVMVTADNPYGLTFDPSYVYGPNQGIRGFLGFRYSIY